MNRPSPFRTSPSSGSGSGFDAEPTAHPIEPSYDALPPGNRLAEYEILSLLSEGEFDIVYLAMDHGLQRQVAVREYLPAALASRGRGTAVALRSDRHAETFALGLKSFIDEARLLARFDHPALVRVYRFWEGNGTAYMVMPYYEGSTVGDTRRAMAHPPNEAWLRDLLMPLLGALDVLHGASSYRVDISPENILLLPNGRPVLLDLGAARHAVRDRAKSATVIHEPGFAPIEQYAESANLRQGPWTNLYSLAAVAYYCISGHVPVASTVRALDDQMEPLFQVVDRLGRSFPGLDYSVPFVSAIERALSVRPQERPQSVAEFRRALLGGVGATHSAEKVAPHGAGLPFPHSPESIGPFEVSASALDGGNVKDAFRERQEPSQPEAEPKLNTVPAWHARTQSGSSLGQAHRGSANDAEDAALWKALDAALRVDPNEFGASSQTGPAGEPRARGGLSAGQAPHGRIEDADDAALRQAIEPALRPDPDEFGESSRPDRDPNAGSWRRTVFRAGAAVALVVLGAGGWAMWSAYRDAGMEPNSMRLSMEPEGQPAYRPPLEPQAEMLAPRPSGTAADPQLPAPEAAAPAGQEGLSSEENAKIADAPAESLEPEPPVETVVAQPPPTAPAPAKLVKKESNNPRVLCGPRTQFSLYRCMIDACERTQYSGHPECRYLRATDTVRALP